MSVLEITSVRPALYASCDRDGFSSDDSPPSSFVEDVSRQRRPSSEDEEAMLSKCIKELPSSRSGEELRRNLSGILKAINLESIKELIDHLQEKEFYGFNSNHQYKTDLIKCFCDAIPNDLQGEELDKVKINIITCFWQVEAISELMTN